MTRTPPTARQLLILADRAERGLTPAEADRLRAGIRALDTARRSAAASAGQLTADYRRVRRQLAAVASLLREARYRGRRSIRIQTLANTLDDHELTEEAA